MPATKYQGVWYGRTSSCFTAWRRVTLEVAATAVALSSGRLPSRRRGSVASIGRLACDCNQPGERHGKSAKGTRHTARKFARKIKASGVGQTRKPVA